MCIKRDGQILAKKFVDSGLEKFSFFLILSFSADYFVYFQWKPRRKATQNMYDYQRGIKCSVSLCCFATKCLCSLVQIFSPGLVTFDGRNIKHNVEDDLDSLQSNMNFCSQRSRGVATKHHRICTNDCGDINKQNARGG